MADPGLAISPRRSPLAQLFHDPLFIAEACMANSSFKDRIRHLIEQCTEDEMATIWPQLRALYEDLYLLRAIQTVQKTRQPGDALTREEACQLLQHNAP